MAIVKEIDSKFHINENGQIIKTSNGEALPSGEPLFLFRGRDYLALPILLKYREMCIADGCNDYQMTLLDGMIERFRKFAEENPQTMKQPGVTRGL